MALLACKSLAHNGHFTTRADLSEALLDIRT
jgi:hypothetical protein